MNRAKLERDAEVVRLFHVEKWKVGTIATQLKLHHSAVTRILNRTGVPAPRKQPRPSILDPYRDFIREVLEKYPTLRASRVFHMLRERGYKGGETRVREVVAQMRPSQRNAAYLRLQTLPGEQGQVDWAHFGKLEIGKAKRPLLAFVMVLSWSRMVFVRFFLGARMPSFLRGHVEAFHAFGGIPRVLLYDNLKSAVLERSGDAIRFHPTMLKLAQHYRFAPRPCAPGRGNEKGRVERAIRYCRESFFAARQFRDLDDLNAQVRVWCETVTTERRWPEDHQRRVAEVFAEERPVLLGLPDDDFPCEEVVPVTVGKTPYARFDGNDYSVPHTCVKKQLVCFASIERVRFAEGATVVASHERSWSRGERVEEPAHIEALVEQKRAARISRAQGRLRHAAPASVEYLMLAASRGHSIRAIASHLLGLLDEYGAAALDKALAEVTARRVAGIPAVRQLLEQWRHAQGRPPPIPIRLPDDPRIRDLVVKPHALNTYDEIATPSRDEEDDDDQA